MPSGRRLNATRNGGATGFDLNAFYVQVNSRSINSILAGFKKTILDSEVRDTKYCQARWRSVCVNFSSGLFNCPNSRTAHPNFIS